MARVILDPVTHPDAVLGDFSTPNPLVTFRKEDVAFIYGTKEHKPILPIGKGASTTCDSAAMCRRCPPVSPATTTTMVL